MLFFLRLKTGFRRYSIKLNMASFGNVSYSALLLVAELGFAVSFFVTCTRLPPKGAGHILEYYACNY